MQNAINVSHTPGPWSLDDDCNYVRADVYRGRKCLEGLDEGWENHPAICNVQPWPAHRWNFMNAEEARANARLISAAPDMLAACEQALLWIEQDEAMHGRNFGAGNALRAAIAKATAVNT